MILSFDVMAVAQYHCLRQKSPYAHLNMDKCFLLEPVAQLNEIVWNNSSWRYQTKKKNKQKAQKLWIWNREITIQHFCFLYRGQSGATNDMIYYGDEGRATCHCHIIVALSYFFVSIEVWCSNAAAAVWPHHIAHIHPHHLCWIYSWKTFRGRPYAPFYTHRPIATATITHIQITNRFWAVALLAPAFPRFHSEQQRPKF